MATPSASAGEDDVLFRVARGIGWITLNRPKAINALTHDMVRRIDDQLVDWTDNREVEAVVLAGAGDRGLCAGGDIVSIYDDARSGGRASVDFWHDEYVMNARIAGYPKPYVAVMDGIVMGGGVGVSAHGSPRIATDRTMMAMPEVGIGLVPDVGGTWLLSRAPGELGTHLALTADRFGGSDAILVGLADRFVMSERLDALLEQLTGDTINAVVDSHASAAPPSALAEQRDWIDSCYSADSVPEIVDRLRAHPEPAAQRAAEQIVAKSPIAVSVALRALREGRTLPNLRAALDQELRIVTTAFESHDLVEGIRAQVIDKDRDPHWSPATLADVTTEDIDRYFTPRPDEGRDQPQREQVGT